ncbi:MAG: CotH kinase family protein, partial [Clostridia bacterium]|nr:CotH kinase family protein [Clostridia bacterium]
DDDKDDEDEDDGGSGLPPHNGPAFEESTPVIYIETEDGEEIPTNKDEVNCEVSLRSNKYEQCADALAATIRVRGNGSLTVGKKVGKYPYKIKFRSKVNPFDLGDGKAKDWVLLAHVGDQSMLRNYAARLLGDMMSGIPYSTNARLVNVYLNGEYIGVYELTEQVEVGKYRIDIDDSRSEAENGFLVELDNYASGTYVRINGQKFAIKSDIYSDEQIDFVEDYLDRVDDAIYDGDQALLSELVDMDSVVDMYIVQEFAKNIDVGWSSFFMYRDVGGKLTFAPPWDFDLSFGNDNRLHRGSYEGLYVGPGDDIMQDHKWYNALYEHSWFRALVQNRWNQVTKTLIPATIRAVRNAANDIMEDMNKNYEVWDILGEKQQQEPSQVYNLTTYQEHVDYLIEWMENRQAWLDREFS